MIKDCGMDGKEDLSFVFPFCCAKHLKEIRIFTRNVINKELKEVLNI